MTAAIDIRQLESQETDVLGDYEHPFSLIVWNDDVNTFDWVIRSLMEICGHTYEQAEQCALFIHFKGKYAVRDGAFEELRPLKTALLDRQISATIEEKVSA